jgi:glycosyltransferase involved in cell wall biosynthesis
MPTTDDGRSARVLLAGTFERDFARNRVIKSLLERAGHDVRVIQRQLWGRDRYLLVDQSKGRLLLRAIHAYASLVWALFRSPRADLIIVLYPGYFDMPIVQLVAATRRIPILFDPFISLHDTLVGDRALRDPRSLLGRATRLADQVACRAATTVLADTPPHADYLAKLTRTNRSRFRVLWLGAQEDVFHPSLSVVPEPRLVVFHGTFIPLQGLETIVRAAKILGPDGIEFLLIGDGQERQRVDALVRELAPGNVQLTGLLPLRELPARIASATVCLGIFGTTRKASRVVPNKLFECLAMGRPVITADTPAIRAGFADGELKLVPAGDPTALALAVRALVDDAPRREEIASAGHRRFKRDYSEAALSDLLDGYVGELVPKQLR